MSRLLYTGPEHADVLIVAESPHPYELNRQEPFSSGHHRLLKQTMFEAGLDPNRVHMTYLMPRKPRMGSITRHFDKFGMPDDQMLDDLVALKERIQYVAPKVVVPMGSTAMWACTPINIARWQKKKQKGEQVGWIGIDDWRGSICEGGKAAAGIKTIPIYAPEKISANYSSKPFFRLDLQRIREQATFPEIRRPQYTVEIAPDADMEAWRRRLLSAPIIYYDIEYIGTKLLCVGFCADAEGSLVVPCDRPDLFEWAKAILESGVPLGAQNGMFDCSVLEWHFSINTLSRLKYDTMLASHAAYIELPKDLGTLCSIYTEQPCYWTHIDWKKIKAGEQPISDVYKYNGIDAWVTYMVAQAQQADELLDPQVRKTFEFEMSLLEPLWEMSKTGLAVDHTKIEALRQECKVAIAEGKRKLAVLTDMSPEEINVQGKMIGRLLFEKMGLKPIKINRTGPSTDDKVLAELAINAREPEQKAVIELIRQIRKSRSLISKFCNIEYDRDGRFRCHYNPGGTNTGRLASKKFYPTGKGANGQNIPRDKRARRVYVADPGTAIFYHDLERAESLVVAYLSGDPLMLEHHQPGKDAHALLARELFECDLEEAKTFYKRYMGKQTRHAGNYMEGWRTFQINVNKYAMDTGIAITAADAKFFINRYRNLHTRLGTWWRTTEALVRKEGKLFNLLGRPRQFFDRASSALPTMVAYVPQSTVGDTLNVGLIRCYHDPELRSLGVKNIFQVHDAIGGTIPVENVTAALKRQRELLRIDLEVPLVYGGPTAGEHFSIPVELGTSLVSWGDIQKVELDD